MRISVAGSIVRTTPRLAALRPPFEAALIVLCLAGNSTLLPHSMDSDARVRFDALTELLVRHHMPTMRYSLIGPIFATPLYLLGHVVGTPEVWVVRYNAVVFAIGLVVAYRLLRERMDRATLRTFLLLVTIASMFPAHLLDFDGEVFTAVCVALGTLAVFRGHERLGWSALVLGVANTPAALGGLAALAAVRAMQTRRVRYALPVVTTGGLIALEAWIRRGSPFDTGYAGDAGFPTVMPYSGLPGFSYPLLFGLLSLLFSFGKGLFFYAPGLLLPARQRLRELAAVTLRLDAVLLLWLAFVAGLALVYARWWAWYGGWFWGPRFFLFASIPAALALAVWLRRPSARLLPNLLALAALVLSLWVGIDGAIFGQGTLGGVCIANSFALEALCWYTPEFSALWRPFVVAESLDSGTIVYAALGAMAAVYLAAPLVRLVWRQARDQARQWGTMYVRAGAWRF